MSCCCSFQADSFHDDAGVVVVVVGAVGVVVVVVAGDVGLVH